MPEALETIKGIIIYYSVLSERYLIILHKTVLGGVNTMKVLYFNIHNGECVPAYTALPAFRATITGSRIHTIETSFNVSNITQYGYEWFLDEVLEENNSWTFEHPHLMKSLKKLALRQSLLHPFKYTNHKELNHRFPFVLVWDENRQFTKACFK